MEIYFSIGSNLGDRKSNIQTAIQLLNNAVGTGYCRISDTMESVAWGFDGLPFLNCIIVYGIPECGVNPELHANSLLRRCKEIEMEMGRSDSPEYNGEGQRIYHNRIIDIDILFHGTDTVSNGKLTVPHSLISQRDFIMTPLRQIVSDVIMAAFKEIFHNNL